MFIGNYSKRQIKKVQPILKKINQLRPRMQGLSDEILQGKTERFKEKLAKGVSLDDLLPEAFAVVREASRRTLGLEPYDVQVIGGILLYYGLVAEMATGEGKTLVAAMPSYLMALEGKGVHVVTVNDYLAKRDAEEIGKIHAFLGLTVGCVLTTDEPSAHKAAYDCDITYVTNNELGFDYLRDNMAQKKEMQVQRGLHYCIIDEVDSILIDEARTPLIISGKGDTPTALYTACDALANQLERGTAKELSKVELMSGAEYEETGDYIVDEKDRLVHLTEAGTKKVEAFFHMENFSDSKNINIQHHMLAALKAHALMHKDKDYVVKDGEILIVDEFTGRILPGRRYSDGLHQAIEAKEHVKVQEESMTYATISFQSFFNLYDKKAGMTGTAMTERQEFRDIYRMDVVSVPTNKPIARVDESDSVYGTKDAKYAAVIAAIEEAHGRQQPVLVGTTTIGVSEHLSDLLCEKGIPHQVLNAKQHEREAEIVAHAGEAGAVTIATNMAGRGTDIKLDDVARANGGLFVIGTERHEARRIDNQLRGRSGRQGDPGKSKFFLSLEDDLLRLFMSESLMKRFQGLTAEGSELPIHDKMLERAVTSSQKRLEGNHFAARKRLLDFDEVNHSQRDWVYNQRRLVLDEQDLDKPILAMLDYTVYVMVTKYCADMDMEKWDMTGFCEAMKALDPTFVNLSLKKKMTPADFMGAVKEGIHREYESRRETFGDYFKDVQSAAVLKSIDFMWLHQLENLEQLRQNLSMIGYGQKDPVVEYKERAYALFEDMKRQVYFRVSQMILHAHYVSAQPAENAEK